MPKQELAQLVTGPEQIDLGVIAGAHQVAQGLMRRIGHPDRRQVACAQQTSQGQGIAPLGCGQHLLGRLDQLTSTL